MAIMVETHITVAEEKAEAFLKEVPSLLEEAKNVPGGLAYRGTKGEVVHEEPYILLQAALGMPALSGPTYIVLSYWDTPENAAAWENSAVHKKLAEYGALEVRKYEQVAEPGQREGLHPDRMQRDFFFSA